MKIISPVNTAYSQSHPNTVEAFRMEDGSVYNFSRWNGEKWGSWWEDGNLDICGDCARPIYEENEYGDFELVGIDF